MNFFNQVKGYFTKFSNDWCMNLAGLLAYNFLGAIFPLLLGILAIAALVLPGGMVQQLGNQLNSAVPQSASGGLNLDFNSVLQGFQAASGLAAIVSFAVLLWTGSNLFGVMDNCFSIVFRTPARSFIEQKVMAVAMIIIFAILAPLAVFASAISGSFSAIESLLGGIPGIRYIVGIGGYAVGVAIAFALFFLIYLIVPNVKLSPRHAWPGALLAAVLFEIVSLVFPFYTQHFMKSSQFGPVVLLLAILTFWFWVISLILLAGAEMNSFVALDQRAFPRDLPGMVHALQFDESSVDTGKEVPDQGNVRHREEADPAFRGWLPGSRQDHVEAEAPGSRGEE